ncbi:MAG: F0F1 ATP synthase subunit A [Parcubacteria group bacterium]
MATQQVTNEEILQAEQELFGGESASTEVQETAAEEVSHEVTLFAEPVFSIGGFTVTNSLLNSWIVVAALVVLAMVLRKKLRTIPSKFQGTVEMIVDGALGLADSVTGDRKKTLKIFPVVFIIFLFILLNNWLGILPGIGSIGYVALEEGHRVFVPYFRGATADFNTTLALALLSVIASNVFGIIVIGGWKYLNKFINIKALAEVPGKLKSNPAIVFVNPIKFFVGLIEFVGEVAKIASLSFRLFGNIFAGEVLLASIAVIFAFALPIPFLFLEIIVGLIQALIFAMLTLVYFTVASTAEEH